MELENVIVLIGSCRHRGLIKVSSNGDCDRVISSQPWIIHISLIIFIVLVINIIVIAIVIVINIMMISKGRWGDGGQSQLSEL